MLLCLSLSCVVACVDLFAHAVFVLIDMLVLCWYLSLHVSYDLFSKPSPSLMPPWLFIFVHGFCLISVKDFLNISSNGGFWNWGFFAFLGRLGGRWRPFPRENRTRMSMLGMQPRGFGRTWPLTWGVSRLTLALLTSAPEALRGYRGP